MRPTLTLAVLLGLAAVGCGPVQGTHAPEPSAAGAWHRLEDPPLSSRRGAVGAWVGGRVVFVGGDTGRPCPPGADCAAPQEYAVDGAAYDPESGAWRRIAEAPVPIVDAAPHAALGDKLFVLSGRTLLGYDVSEDAWSTTPTPHGLEWAQIVVDDDRLVFVSGSDEEGVRPDRVLDPATGTWSVLPEDPIGLAFDRSMTATTAGLVLTAHELVEQPGSAEPSVVLAALLDPRTDAWTKLPDSDQLGGGRWHWTGVRLVDASLGAADGGKVNGWGRRVPYGGILDPVTGEWSRLPHPPDELTGGWPVDGAAGPVIATSGWLYDDVDGSWRRLQRPADAPPRPGTAIWADDLLVVYGGMDDAGGRSAEDAYATGAWAFDPAR